MTEIEIKIINGRTLCDETAREAAEEAKEAAESIKLPDKLPSPAALTFAGAVTGSYDGSRAVTITIPGAATVYMRVSEGYIQYSTDNAVWNNVIAVEELQGPQGDDYILTEEDKAEIAEAVKGSFTTEDWTFTLEDDSEVVKRVVLG